MLADIRRVFRITAPSTRRFRPTSMGKALVARRPSPSRTTLHARCGTTFLIMVAFVVSVVAFSIAGYFIKPYMPPMSGTLEFLAIFVGDEAPAPAGHRGRHVRDSARPRAVLLDRAASASLLWPGFLVPEDHDRRARGSMQLDITLASLRAALAHAKVKLPEDPPRQDLSRRTKCSLFRFFFFFFFRDPSFSPESREKGECFPSRNSRGRSGRT